MRCAVERLPSHIIELMNFCTRSLPYTESVVTSRRGTNPLRGICFFSSFPALLLRRGLGPLGAVFRAPLLAVLHAGGIERPANHVIAHAGKILHAAGAHEHDRVLLQAGTDPGNVGGDLNGVGQGGARDFSQRGIGFPGRLRGPTNANAALFRTSLQRRRLCLGPDLIAPESNQLCKRRHGSPSNELDFTSLSTARNSARRRVVEFSLRKGTGAIPEHPTTNSALLPVSRFYFLVEAERVTRLCGAGAPFRPLFLPRSVLLCSGARRLSLSLQGKTIPDEAVSIGKKEGYVKCNSYNASGNLFASPNRLDKRKKT